MDIYVALNGNDDWSGRLPEPNAAATDGPVRFIETARDIVVENKLFGITNEAATVHLRGGTYHLTKPIVFKTQDSYPITFQPYMNEDVTLSGGIPVRGWQDVEINGVQAWCANVDAILEHFGPFKSLFVEGERRSLARYPKKGYLGLKRTDRIAEHEHSHYFCGNRAANFYVEPNVLPRWHSTEGAVVRLSHLWTEEHLLVDHIDHDASKVYCKNKTALSVLSEEKDYSLDFFIENLLEECTDPGEWYLDEQQAKLYYVPMEGESKEATELTVPILSQLLKIEGEPEKDQYVRGIKFENIRFAHCDWYYVNNWGYREDPYREDGKKQVNHAYEVPGTSKERSYKNINMAQGTPHMPGMIELYGAKNCCIENCHLSRGGFNAIYSGNGSQGNRLVGNDISDFGAGGLVISGASIYGDKKLWNGKNVISDNKIYDCSKIFAGGEGIFIGHSHDNQIVHNTLYNLLHNGISCGWTWGYSANNTYNNLIAYNHIHHLGGGCLSDMGGIYTLGVQHGTVLRGNYIHHVSSKNYGGWGVYLDEGSSHMVVEDHIVHDTDCAPFNQHFGRENIVRHNIFVGKGEGVISLGYGDSDVQQMTILKNILISDGVPLYYEGYRGQVMDAPFKTEGNIIWELNDGFASGQVPYMARGKGEALAGKNNREQWAHWLDHGNDCLSIHEDPQFDLENLRLSETSCAHRLRFKTLDVSRCGVRERGDREVQLPKVRGRYLSHGYVVKDQL